MWCSKVGPLLSEYKVSISCRARMSRKNCWGAGAIELILPRSASPTADFRHWWVWCYVYLESGQPTDVQNVHQFLQIFNSLILLILWICGFCDFMSYWAFGLYVGCMDFLPESQPQGQRGKENGLAQRMFTMR